MKIGRKIGNRKDPHLICQRFVLCDQECFNDNIKQRFNKAKITRLAELSVSAYNLLIHSDESKMKELAVQR